MGAYSPAFVALSITLTLSTAAGAGSHPPAGEEEGKPWKLSRSARLSVRTDPVLRKNRQTTDPASGARIETIHGTNEPEWFSPEQLYQQLIQDVFIWESEISRTEVERYLVTTGRGESFLEVLEESSREYIALELTRLAKRADGETSQPELDESIRTMRARCRALATARAALGDDSLMSVLYEVVAPWMSVAFNADNFNPEIERAALNSCVDEGQP